MLSVEQKYSKRNRLLRPDEFSRVFAACVRSGDRYFLVLARTNELPFARLGLAISKKKTKRAIDRNRLKRLIRESFRSHQHFLAGLDIVVLNQRGEAMANNSQYFASLTKHWHKLVKRCDQSQSC